MSKLIHRLALTGAGILVATVLAGCVAGVGYDGDVGIGYSPGYIEPFGYDYGGWGGGYRVGPSRGGERRSASPSAHGYRAAPQSRATPSIPSRSRGGRH